MKEDLSFEEIVRQYQDMVYNTVIGIVQQPEDAEEITQDVFLKVHESMDSFRGDAKVSTWLYRIAINKSIDFTRKKSWKMKKMVSSILPGTQEPESFYHPGVALDRKEDAAEVFRAIEHLPSQQKAAFILQKLEGLSSREIADVLDVSTDAADSLLARARKNLQSMLENYYKKHF